MSGMAAATVMTASRMPSGIWAPSASSTASVNIAWPVCRTNSSDAPAASPADPSPREVRTIVGEAAGEGAPAFDDLHLEGALHERQPRLVGGDLVGGVDGGDRVLEVHDRRERGLEKDVAAPRGIGGADRAVAVDRDLEVQAVVDQDHGVGCGGVAAIADELRGIGEAA